MEEEGVYCQIVLDSICDRPIAIVREAVTESANLHLRPIRGIIYGLNESFESAVRALAILADPIPEQAPVLFLGETGWIDEHNGVIAHVNEPVE